MLKNKFPVGQSSERIWFLVGSSGDEKTVITLHPGRTESSEGVSLLLGGSLKQCRA